MTALCRSQARALRQKGAALLLAMLTVGLAATLGASAYWQQWRAWAIERTERERAQAGWLLTGALDWARFIIREDARASTVDHLGEPWAVPLQAARLSAFLQRPADGGTDAADEAWLSGRIEDAQGRLNWRNLVEVVGDKPRISAIEKSRFERLFAQLGLSQSELEAVSERLLQAWERDDRQRARPLRPQRLSDLRAFGLSSSTLATLEPLTVWLPSPTPLNVNTAPAAVLQAALPGLDMGGVQRLTEQRARQHFSGVAAFVAAVGRPGVIADVARFGVNSRYFLVSGRVRIGALQIEQHALLMREGARVGVVWRQQNPVIGSVSAR